MVNRCRICGLTLDASADNVLQHEVAYYWLNNDQPSIEYIHAFCDAVTPSPSSELPEGYMRHPCKVLSAYTIQIMVDHRAVSDSKVLPWPVSKLKLSLMRNQPCIYYNNALMVDIPIDIAKQFLQ